MENQYGWGHDLINDDSVALEAFGDVSLVQGPGDQSDECSFFKPINITVEQGIIYMTVYICHVENHPHLSEGLKIFLSSLKKTDHIKLSISSTLTGIPFIRLADTLTAFATTPAKVTIVLNQIVTDGLAYFYLLADRVDVKTGGAIFVPSYVDQRSEDMSKPWQSAHDFFEWILDDAVILNRLTKEEADTLRSGRHVIPNLNKFK